MVGKESISSLYAYYVDNVLSVEMLKPWADEIGVSVQSLQRLGVGIQPDNGSLIIPERDELGNVIGLQCRFFDGKKLMVKGSKRGLIYASNPDYNGKDSVELGNQKWVRLHDAGVVCPICGKPDWCMVSSDDVNDPQAVLCSRVKKGSTKHIPESGYLHIRKNDGKVCVTNVLADTEGVIAVVEGFTDTATAFDLGLVGVGKPSAEGGNKLLKLLVKNREVIIVGDNDAGAGKKGMDATFETLKDICSSLIKVLPPIEFKDLRVWNRTGNLTPQVFVDWVVQHGEKASGSDILPDSSPLTIADLYITRMCTEDGLPTIRNHNGNWLKYGNGCYQEFTTEEFRGGIYSFLRGKKYPAKNTKGETVLSEYVATRAKVSDVIDAFSTQCPVIQDAPTWLRDADIRPDPKNLVAFRNGILDINEYIKGNMVLYPATPAFFSYNVLPYEFDEHAESELWSSFLNDIFSDELEKISLLAQWFGYNLVPDMSMEKLMFFVGRPRSGKGTVIEAMTSMLGRKQCASTSFQALSSEFGYQPLVGKLAAILSDARVPNRREAESSLEKILQIVGLDSIGVRRMYREYLTSVNLKCRFTVAMNDLPELPDQVNALESKLSILTFNNSYAGREDITLKSRLSEQAGKGLLINFALRGLKDLRSRGHFVETESGTEMIHNIRELTTPIATFIRDCCKMQPPGAEEYVMSCDELYEGWQHWCKEQGCVSGSRAQFSHWICNSLPSVRRTRRNVDRTIKRCFSGIKMADWAYRLYLGVNKK